MNAKERKLAAHFLGEAADVLGNNTCNDVDESVWAEWTLDERKAFVKEFNEWNGSTDEYDENFLYLFDYAICGFLASKLIDNGKK